MRHGFYTRFVLVHGGARSIFVLRLRCQGCGKTFGVLPVWAIPHRQVTWLVLWRLLLARLVQGRTLVASLTSARGPGVPIWHRQAQEWIRWAAGWWPRLALALTETWPAGARAWPPDLVHGCRVLAGRPDGCPLLPAVTSWRRLVVSRRLGRLWAPPLGLPRPAETN